MTRNEAQKLAGDASGREWISGHGVYTAFPGRGVTIALGGGRYEFVPEDAWLGVAQALLGNVDPAEARHTLREVPAVL